MMVMKLSNYAKKHGITYLTAFRSLQNGHPLSFSLARSAAQSGWTSIEVANLAENTREDLLQDFSRSV
jgi:hypothetical protein